MTSNEVDMGTVDLIRERRKISGEVARARVVGRTSERQSTANKIDADGVLAAAGIGAATRRAAIMSSAEGRSVARRRGRIDEAILAVDDIDHVAFLARGQQAARSVCRLAIGSQPVGTGFLVGPDLLLTNNHVIATAAEAREFTAEFDFELDIDDQPRVPIQRFQLDPDRAFVTSSSNDLDFTLVGVRPVSVGGAPLSALGWLPLDGRLDKILIGEPAVIIQHPRGEQKRICIFSAEIVDRLENHLHYTTDTDHGSSGSCVLNRSWQLVALHHAAVESGRKKRGQGEIVNEGVRVTSILAALKNNDRDRIEGMDGRPLYALLTDDAVVRDGRPQRGRAPAAARSTIEESVPRPATEHGEFEPRDGPIPQSTIDELRSLVRRLHDLLARLTTNGASHSPRAEDGPTSPTVDPS